MHWHSISPDNYVSIPYRSGNHPEKEITVSTWFYVDSFDPQDLISTYNNGGYRLAFGDGNDLWWTVYLRGAGDVSVPVQHEGITLRQWHHVTGTYDGQVTKIYLDGVLRNQVNATGPIAYEFPNYVILGAAAGTYDTPDPVCTGYLHGGLDEVRIYNQAVPYSQIMDDRFRCSQELAAPSPVLPSADTTSDTCTPSSGLASPGTRRERYPYPYHYRKNQERDMADYHAAGFKTYRENPGYLFAGQPGCMVRGDRR